MKTKPPIDRKAGLLLDAAARRFNRYYATGRFTAALAESLQATRIAPSLAAPWADAAVCAIRLERWDEAIGYAQRARELGSNSLATLDALSHAYGGKLDWAAVRNWGTAALQERRRQFDAPPPIAHHPAELPPPPSPSSRQQNLIAFSLFGEQAKYCECAVLNVAESPRLYPDWTCRFYIDESVPSGIVKRLQAGGGEICRVSPQQKQRLPGPMWRFLAYDSPGVQRVIFRDADSVISGREQTAVEAWVASNKRFHLMRDSSTHTELILAGLWGTVGGALPPMQTLLDAFLRQPVASAHFADQHFLRQFVWPYASQSLLQHDSVFGFLDGLPFPDGPVSAQQHVGCPEASVQLRITTDLPEGTPVVWTLYRVGETAGNRYQLAVCRYPGIVCDGHLSDRLPRRYAREIEAGTMSIRIQERPPGATTAQPAPAY